MEIRRRSETGRICSKTRCQEMESNCRKNRSGKSCRLRWLNYLKPGIKRGNMSEDEEDLIQRLHKLLGNRWSLIAGRLPGRTDNEIKNYWNFHLKTRVLGETETNNIPSKHKTSRTSYYEKEPTTSGNNNHECHAGNPNANQIDNECQAAGNLNANQINEADNCFDWSPHISDCSEWVNRLLDLDVEQWLQEDMDILN
uniref:Uncharacterized protein n=1 Tax=Kalanchoe fedtschenkoi TaxID=63787 RepID=A0A7N0V4H9_KALFE